MSTTDSPTFADEIAEQLGAIGEALTANASERDRLMGERLAIIQRARHPEEGRPIPYRQLGEWCGVTEQAIIQQLGKS